MASIRHAGLLSWLHVMRIHAKIQHRSQEQLKQYDLSLAQFDVLAHLSISEGMSQQQLAERLYVTKGNVCGLIDRLSSRGLVQRCDNPDDRRSNMLYLSDKGKALADEVVPAHQRLIEELMGRLSADEQRFLQILLSRLDQSLKSD